MEWSRLDGLTTEANDLFAEEWALLDWLVTNIDTATPAEVREVINQFVANGHRIGALGERKFA